MKKIILILIIGLPVLANAQKAPTLKQAVPFAATITAEDLKAKLSILASAEMEGRETATVGQRKAAAYIEQFFKSLGLTPGNKGQYQQFYPVYRDSVVSAALSINQTKLSIQKDFSVTADNYTANLGFSEVVYVNFDDSLWQKGKINVTGKLVMFAFNGLSGAGAARGFGNTIMNKLNQVMAKGAAAALVVQDIFPMDKPADVLGNMRVEQFTSRQSINYFSISAEAAKLILKDSMESFTAKKLYSKVFPADVFSQFAEQPLILQSSNVVALMEGTDKSDEYLFITGHYDHLGKRGDVIYYGADDDGSGSSSVLELAETFVKAKAAGKGPRRNIVFMTVSGEEKGLWGSEAYANTPIYPLEKTTADLNIDMIGRLDSIHIKMDSTQYIYIVGDDKLSSDLKPITNKANAFTKLQLDPKYNDPKDPQRIYYRSDHYNFAAKGVPIIFYFSGLHPDYHRPTDTVDRINFPEMTKRAQLVFYTAWEIANRDDMLKRDIPLPTGTIR